MKKKAFSLIELIISLAIISFLILVLSNIFSLNINILNKSYQEENEYKEAYTAMAYMDATIRSSHRIVKEKNQDSNFIGHIVRNSGDDVAYYFFAKDGFLCIHGDNLNTTSDGNLNKISECDSVNLFYDEDKKVITIKLVSKYQTYTLESAIYVGDKLWKKNQKMDL